MRAYTLSVEPFKGKNYDIALSRLVGRVVAASVPDYERGTGFLFRKGDILHSENLNEWLEKILSLAKSAPENFALHLLEIEAGEVSEDQAGIELAKLIAGPGLELRPPVESRVNLLARRRGLLKIDLARLEEINDVAGIAVFTAYDGQAVLAGTEVAGAKVISLVYPLSRLAEVGKIVGDKPIIDVLPFQPMKVGIVVRERLQAKARERFTEAVTKKMNWFGTQVLGIEVATDDPADLTQKLNYFKQRQADLILHVGGHSNDPLDPIFATLDDLGVEMERHGAPAHPGTLFWLAYWQNTTIFGLASCGMFSKTTLGDMFMAQLFAGVKLTRRDIARWGHGGLFTREMAFRFPPYGLESLENIGE